MKRWRCLAAVGLVACAAPTPAPAPLAAPTSAREWPGVEVTTVWRVADVRGFPSLGGRAKLGPDVDGDGAVDLLVASFRTRKWPGRLAVMSGRTGEILSSSFEGGRGIESELGQSEFPEAFCIVADRTGDGTPEVAVSRIDQGYRTDVVRWNQILILDPKTGRDVARITSETVWSSLYAQDLERIADIDGDGAAEFVVGMRWRNLDKYGSGNGEDDSYSAARFEVCDGATFESLAVGKPEYDGSSSYDVFRWLKALSIDVDGDGLSDFAVGYDDRVDAHSSVDARFLRTLATDAVIDGFVEVDDLDGDGVADFAVANATLGQGGYYSHDITPSGVVRFVSSADGREVGRIGPFGEPFFGSRLVVVPDIDRGGQRDLLVGCEGEERSTHYVLFSSETRAALDVLKLEWRDDATPLVVPAGEDGEFDVFRPGWGSVERYAVRRRL